ncbi:DUF4229 domain-containing protein [Streptantibioticus parmotrematis]
MSWKPSAMLRYTALRAGLFVVSFGVIWGLVYLHILPAGLGKSNLLWVLLLALVVSAPLSYVLLRGARDRASVQISDRVERSRAAYQAKAADEDEADDAARAQSA